MGNSYFKNKNIFLTGITGFVGSHLEKKLTELGANIYGLSRSIEGKNLLQSTLLDSFKINSFIKEKNIDIIYHLAGESLVETGEENPYVTFNTNIEGTLNILEASRKNNVKQVIIASTSHVYGRNKVPYYEGYTPRPSRPYETSKACTDLIAQSYADTYNLPVFIPRFVNIYGPQDLHFTRLIPKIIKALVTETPLPLWGGDAIREYLYIDDAIGAYLTLATAKIPQGKNRIFNFGSGNRISVKQLVEKLEKISGKKVTVERTKVMRKLEILHQYVSSNKTQKILGWKAHTSLDEGLERTYSWYEKYFK